TWRNWSNGCMRTAERTDAWPAPPRTGGAGTPRGPAPAGARTPGERQEGDRRGAVPGGGRPVPPARGADAACRPRRSGGPPPEPVVAGLGGALHQRPLGRVAVLPVLVAERTRVHPLDAALLGSAAGVRALAGAGPGVSRAVGPAGSGLLLLGLRSGLRLGFRSGFRLLLRLLLRLGLRLRCGVADGLGAFHARGHRVQADLEVVGEGRLVPRGLLPAHAMIARLVLSRIAGVTESALHPHFGKARAVEPLHGLGHRAIGEVRKLGPLRRPVRVPGAVGPLLDQREVDRARGLLLAADHHGRPDPRRVPVGREQAEVPFPEAGSVQGV